MRRNTLPRLIATGLLCLGGFGASKAGSAAAARPMIDRATYMLHGTGPFSKAVARASVTRLSGDRFSLSLTAAHLPPPAIMHVKFTRHAYVA
jgi:hypothetical protein